MSDHKFDRSLNGVFGTFGAGMNLEISFLQTALRPDELSHISLVEEIPGSEKWPIRDLFQRNVDHGRVHSSILPWLRDDGKIKFFSPLTLVLLPTGSTDKKHGWSEMPSLKVYSRPADNGHTWENREYPDYYRFRFLNMNGRPTRQVGEVAWNSNAVHLVAIDGQHRLTALRELVGDTNIDFDWDIPVVVTGLGHNRDSSDERRPRLLEVARSMFVYINTQAQKPTQARQILLHDENVSHICTQEVLQYAHDNDCREHTSLEASLPLLFFDWRGETQDGRSVQAPAALISTVELSSWLGYYVLKTSDPIAFAECLGIGKNEPVVAGITDELVSLEDAEYLRVRFQQTVLPGLITILESFSPFNNYILELRKIEKKYEEFSDASRQALSMLRFGFQTARQQWEQGVQSAYSEIVEDLMDAKSQLPFLLTHDVGLRSIAFCFGSLRSWFHNWAEEDMDPCWDPYSQWFVECLNHCHHSGIFTSQMDAERLFLTKNYSGRVVNYRLGDIPKSMGPFLAIAVAAFSHAENGFPSREELSGFWESRIRPTLFATLKKGYFQHFKSLIASENPGWSADHVKSRAIEKARSTTHGHLTRIQNRLQFKRGGDG